MVTGAGRAPLPAQKNKNGILAEMRANRENNYMLQKQGVTRVRRPSPVSPANGAR